MTEYGLKQTFATTLAANDATQQESALGLIRFDGNKTYRYVYVVDKAVTEGDSVCQASSADGVVSADRSGGSQVALCVRGVAIGAISSGYYGWIQIKGVCTVQCDGAVVTGDGLVPHASNDGHADTVNAASDAANTEYQIFGFALTQDAGASDGDTATAFINCA
jgi:hypothetical protein